MSHKSTMAKMLIEMPYSADGNGNNGIDALVFVLFADITIDTHIKHTALSKYAHDSKLHFKKLSGPSSLGQWENAQPPDFKVFQWQQQHKKFVCVREERKRTRLDCLTGPTAIDYSHIAIRFARTHRAYPLYQSTHTHTHAADDAAKTRSYSKPVRKLGNPL